MTNSWDPIDCSLNRLLCPWDFPSKNTGMGCHFFSRGSSQPRSWTQVSCIAGRFFTNWATRESLRTANQSSKLNGSKVINWLNIHQLLEYLISLILSQEVLWRWEGYLYFSWQERYCFSWELNKECPLPVSTIILLPCSHKRSTASSLFRKVC